MHRGLYGLRRRALGLQRARLYPYAERAFSTWRAAAEAQEAWASAADAAMCSIRLALERDRPSAALAMGAEALPKVLGRSRIDPNVLARLFLFLAKAAWYVGSAADMRAFADAARHTVEHEPVEPLVRAHFGIVQAMVAIDGDDLKGATAWALQALDVARAIGDDPAIMLCWQNLSYLWAEQKEFARAHAIISGLLVPGARDPELVDLLVNAVHIALGSDDLAKAGEFARRAVQAYCEAPSMLSPVSVAFLFEALACYYAAAGGMRAAELLGATARAWFALRNRQREVRRVERRLADLRPDGRHTMQTGDQVDPDLLYLGDLFDAVYKVPDRTMARGLAISVHHLLRKVEPDAPPTPCEHAAILRALTPGERWFTGRSSVGQAAERVLSRSHAPGRVGLDFLAAFEGVARSGASWTEGLRALRRTGIYPGGVSVLDRLYSEATA